MTALQTDTQQNTPKARKRLARLVAVQALFQADLMQQPASAVLKEFERHRLTLKNGKPTLADPDSDDVIGQVDTTLMREIVSLTLDNQTDLAALLAANLPADWALARLERPLRLILLAGLAEIRFRAETPLAVIVSDYVDVAHAYLGEREPGMVNAILDKAGKALRS